jgi:hypothetical protein
MHFCPMQRSPVVHAWQELPPMPHTALVTPIWHRPLASQQPFVHVDGPQGAAQT